MYFSRCEKAIFKQEHHLQILLGLADIDPPTETVDWCGALSAYLPLLLLTSLSTPFIRKGRKRRAKGNVGEEC